MSYLVLARKYRPLTFSEVVGQEHVTRTMANAFGKDRVHHAFLLCGPRGVGKTTLARILGKALNCEHGPTAEPCGKCSACTSITAGNAVDYVEMDGASNRGIDAIRDLTDGVRYQPALLRKKVYVIDEVHMLTTEAFNALLKTLEEPPPHVTFILATTEPHKVPNTILSRCQRYDFKLVPAPRLAAHLERIFAAEALPIEPGAVSLIVRESGGSVRDALSLSDQIISYVGEATIRESDVAEVLGVADRALTRSMVTALATGDARTALEAVDAATDRGVDEVQLARAVVRYLRDLAVLQVARGADGLVDASLEERAELMAVAAELAPRRVVQMFDRMIRCCDDLGKTLQPRLVLDLALIDVAALEPLLPLGDLIDRLGDLEQKIARGGGTTGGGGGSARPSRPAAPTSAPTTTTMSTAPSPASAAPAASTAPPSPASAAPPSPASTSPQPAPAPISAAAGEIPGPTTPAPPAPAPTPTRTPILVETAPPPRLATPTPTPSLPANAATAVPEPVRAVGSDPWTANPLAEWEKVLAALDAGRKLTLLGCFEHAKLMAWTATAIEIGFSPDFAMADVLTKEKVEDMRQFLLARYGRPIAFSVRTLSESENDGSSARSVLEVSHERARDERVRREAEAREHPMTKLVLSTFGATIEEIKTDVG